MIICWRKPSSPVTLLRASLLIGVALLSACATKPHKPAPIPPAPAPQVATPRPAPLPPSIVLPGPTPPITNTPQTALPQLKPVGWSAIPAWRTTPLAESWNAYLQGCTVLQKKSAWQNVCDAASHLTKPEDTAVRVFFERYFQAYASSNEDGSTEGLVTGYYEPLIKGSRTQTARARFPIYAVPDDLIAVDLVSVYPEPGNSACPPQADSQPSTPRALRPLKGTRPRPARTDASPWGSLAGGSAAGPRRREHGRGGARRRGRRGSASRSRRGARAGGRSRCGGGCGR